MVERLRVSLRERIIGAFVDPFAERVIDSLTNFKGDPRVTQRTTEIIASGGTPIAYANHEGHAEGLAAAKIAEYIRGISRQIPGHPVKGLATIYAASYASGHQGEELKTSHDLLIGGARNKGLEPIKVTREKDKGYGMNRDHTKAELRLIGEKFLEGFGVAILPEGSVQGGRLLTGAKESEDINGIIEIQNKNLTNLYRAARKRLAYKDRFPYFQPFGFYGSFLIMQSPEGLNPQPKFTPDGKTAMVLGAFGFRTGLAIDIVPLMPFTEEDIIADLGSDWLKDPLTFNKYAMRRILPGIPPNAWGVFRYLPAPANAEPIELLSAS